MARPRYEHYQSVEAVTISVFAKDVAADRSSVVVAEDGRSVRMALGLPMGEVCVLELELAGAVQRGPGGEPAALSIRPSKVEVRLTKAPGATFMWPALERGSGPQLPASVSAPAAPAPAVPSAASLPSAYAGQPGKARKDWSAVEAEAEAEEAKPEGEEALMKLFRQIYAGGDEATRQAMVKSYQTSGGTVLSTNWKEVAATDYEKNVQAPAGMEAKKW